jgi:transcriptional regulator with XRE-family HTH domain
MARREGPLDPFESPRHAFAHDLRSLREKSGLTYRQLEKAARYSRTTLADAASGKVWPTLDVVRAYVAACGGDVDEWVTRWQEANTRLSAEQARAAESQAEDRGLARAYAAISPADRHLVDLLAAVYRYWVTADLGRRLELTGRLPVRLMDDTERLDTTTIRDVLRHSPHLLVLGAPGTGKTVLLQELVQELVDGWADDPTQPVPVLIPLSSWAQRRGPLDGWLVDQLFRLYSVDRKLAWQWIEARRVLPLLDGLDEVPAQHREACVGAINDYQRERGAVHPLVVTCRTAVYLVADDSPSAPANRAGEPAGDRRCPPATEPGRTRAVQRARGRRK